ncbi:gamma-glutamylcyclotransferase family protein [Shouchella clausii]|uniref:gamma-glutamylcyclotransferase family protein n=1 Tax=Shouchella clausii TaxID=79880 RepID=UPI000BA6E17D|nr:gamma-glutamylcyclotransferase family protein [Shouchella clausii]PAD44048.1 hypothetical protein CHH54_03465 [Bacillus sp. 7520-S]PAD92406.1 hypothetical protein CHH52_10505 [Shouchella clausii]
MQGNNKNLLFVYGTLRKGGANDHYLQHSELVEGLCWITGEMHNTPFGYPIVRFRGQEKIIGELYAITSEELDRIDKLEGYDPEGKSENEYERVESLSIQTKARQLLTRILLEKVSSLLMNQSLVGIGSFFWQERKRDVDGWNVFPYCKGG